MCGLDGFLPTPGDNFISVASLETGDVFNIHFTCCLFTEPGFVYMTETKLKTKILNLS